MPMSLNPSGLRDNHTRGTVAQFLQETIHQGSLLSVVSAYFTIYAYDALKDSLDRIEHLDFLRSTVLNRLSHTGALGLVQAEVGAAIQTVEKVISHPFPKT